VNGGDDDKDEDDDDGAETRAGLNCVACSSQWKDNADFIGSETVDADADGDTDGDGDDDDTCDGDGVVAVIADAGGGLTSTRATSRIIFATTAAFVALGAQITASSVPA
jgi:hypothetical protein